MARVQQLDARRRLRLLIAGLLLGISPVLALELLGLFTNTDPFNSDRYFFYAILAMPLRLLVPATLAYVLVVQRAMDVGVVLRQGLPYAFARRSVEILRLFVAGLMICVLVELSNGPSFIRIARYLALSGFLLAIILMEPAARIYYDQPDEWLQNLPTADPLLIWHLRAKRS